jgi:hypothetical protein
VGIGDRALGAREFHDELVIVFAKSLADTAVAYDQNIPTVFFEEGCHSHQHALVRSIDSARLSLAHLLALLAQQVRVFRKQLINPTRLIFHQDAEHSDFSGCLAHQLIGKPEILDEERFSWIFLKPPLDWLVLTAEPFLVEGHSRLWTAPITLGLSWKMIAFGQLAHLLALLGEAERGVFGPPFNSFAKCGSNFLVRVVHIFPVAQAEV